MEGVGDSCVEADLDRDGKWAVGDIWDGSVGGEPVGWGGVAVATAKPHAVGQVSASEAPDERADWCATPCVSDTIGMAGSAAHPRAAVPVFCAARAGSRASHVIARYTNLDEGDDGSGGGVDCGVGGGARGGV